MIVRCPDGMAVKSTDEGTFCISQKMEPNDKLMALLRSSDKSTYRKVLKRTDQESLKSRGALPAVYATYSGARAYCAATYTGGDLPTQKQWVAACGDRDYCSNWGRLSDEEWEYEDEPVDPGFNYAYAHYGILDMGGRVWEMVRNSDDRVSDFIILGGQRSSVSGSMARSAAGIDMLPNLEHGVSFRCVAPVLHDEPEEPRIEETPKKGTEQAE